MDAAGVPPGVASPTPLQSAVLAGAGRLIASGYQADASPTFVQVSGVMWLCVCSGRSPVDAGRRLASGAGVTGYRLWRGRAAGYVPGPHGRQVLRDRHAKQIAGRPGCSRGEAVGTALGDGRSGSIAHGVPTTWYRRRGGRRISGRAHGFH
jgi:hypothetical protein